MMTALRDNKMEEERKYQKMVSPKVTNRTNLMTSKIAAAIGKEYKISFFPTRPINFIIFYSINRPQWGQNCPRGAAFPQLGHFISLLPPDGAVKLPDSEDWE